MSDIKKLLSKTEEAGKPTEGERGLLINSLSLLSKKLESELRDCDSIIVDIAIQELESLQAENAELRKRERELVSAIEDIPDKADPSLYLKGLDRPTEFAISQAKSRAIGAVMDKVRSAKKLTKGE